MSNRLKSIKKWVVKSLVVLLAVGSGGQAVHGAAAAEPNPGNVGGYNDIKGHWAEQQLQLWVDSGWLSGYGDGKLRPDQPVKRSELAALINRAYGKEATAASALAFKDVKKESWDYSTVATAVYAGYVNGYEDGTFRPSGKVTRQEAAVMLAKASDVEGSAGAESTFIDKDALGVWSRSYVAALASQGILGGYPDGSFRPAGQLTRAEAVTAISKAVKLDSPMKEYNKAGVFGPSSGNQEVNGNVQISASGVTLQNLVIRGDLILDKGIGEGDAFLSGVKVTGKTYIRGGGVHSIHIKDSQLSDVRVDKDGSAVRLSVEGKSELGSVTVEPNAAGSVVALQSGSRILKLLLNAKTFVSGQGIINEAILRHDASDSVFEKEPLSKKVLPNPSSQPSPTPSPNVGGGGFFPGFPGNPGNPTPTPSPTGSPVPTVAPEALLMELSVGGYPLTQFPSDKTGFDPKEVEYDVYLPVDFVTGDLEVKAVASHPDIQISVTAKTSYGDILIEDKKLDSDGKVRYRQQARQEVDVFIRLESKDGKMLKGYWVRVLYDWSLAENAKITSDGSITFKGKGIEEGDMLRVYTNEGDVAPVYAIPQSASGENISIRPISKIKQDGLNGNPGSIWISLQKQGQPEQPRQKVEYDFRALAELSGGVKASAMTKEDMEAANIQFTYGVKLELDSLSPAPAGAEFVRASWSSGSHVPRTPSAEDAEVSAWNNGRLYKLNGTSTELMSYWDNEPKDFRGYFTVYYYNADKRPIGYSIVPLEVKVHLTADMLEKLIQQLPVPAPMSYFEHIDKLQRMYQALLPEEQPKVSSYPVLAQALKLKESILAQETAAKQLKSLSLSGMTLNVPFSPTVKQYNAKGLHLLEGKEIVVSLDYDSELSDVYVSSGSTGAGNTIPVQGKQYRFTLGPEFPGVLQITVKSKASGSLESYIIFTDSPYRIKLSPSGGMIQGLTQGVALHVYGSQDDTKPYYVAQGSSSNWPSLPVPGMPLPAPGVPFLMDLPFSYPVHASLTGSIWLSLQVEGQMTDRTQYKYDFTPLPEVAASGAVIAFEDDAMLSLLQSQPSIQAFSYTRLLANLAVLDPAVRYISGQIGVQPLAPTVQDARKQILYRASLPDGFLGTIGTNPAPGLSPGILYLFDAGYNPIGYVRFEYQAIPKATPQVVKYMISLIKLDGPIEYVKPIIERARAAYNLLNEAQKAEVSNYSHLLQAEANLLRP
ncbi:S-layer homology domain-containing protein [Paenibacillaceae bacterium GAS479]|nr:S-layer homology domain-containing protein [Paenibacillaceae bacterium GAS479]